MSRLVYLCMLLPLIIPTAIFSLCALTEGLSLAEMFIAVFKQITTKRLNLLICGAVGLVPILLLLLVLWVYRRAGGSDHNKYWMAWGGLFPVILVLTWVNFQFWPLFLPNMTYPGFPHGLELIIGPVIFAPISMLPGIGIGWWIGRKRS